MSYWIDLLRDTRWYACIPLVLGLITTSEPLIGLALGWFLISHLVANVLALAQNAADGYRDRA